ncbi:MAG: trehalose-6-phosphate synthase, partial [Mesorhizobium sp.]
RPTFRESDWEAYEAVNRKFAETVVAEARNERPIVLVQDYHFALLPRMIRERLPEAIVITFWHIPWPNSEVFSICPWRERILDGLLGSSIVGFHTQFHANNFTESVDRFMESRIERADAAISYGGQVTLVHSYPISIEWPVELLKALPSVEESRARVRKRFRIPAGAKLCVGVERLDYTKGILDRFHALE